LLDPPDLPPASVRHHRTQTAQKNERQDQAPARRLRLDRLSRLSHARCCHRGKPHQSGNDSGAYLLDSCVPAI